MRGVSSDAAPVAIANFTMFLDTIPMELLENVVRFLSVLPHAENWCKHIPLRNLMKLYHVNGTSGRFLSRQFHTLCALETVQGAAKLQVYKSKVPGESMLSTDRIDVAHDFISRAEGESRHSIIIGDEMYDEVRNGKDMIVNFLGACPNVGSLSVVENSGLWVCAFARQLVKLHVVTKNLCDAIPKFCPSLLGLSFVYRGSARSRFINWGNLGSELESLVLFNIRYLFDIDVLICSNNLKHIDIYSALQDNTTVTAIMAPYQDQFDFARVYSMAENELNLVSRACESAVFHDFIDHEPVYLSNLRILGPRLEMITLLLKHNDISDMDTGELAAARSSCSNL